MDELIRVKNEDYGEYEDLLLRRDKLKKSAALYQKAYMHEFGDLITKIFEKKIECIKKKKMISFCQAAINQGKPVDQAALQEYLRKEMEEYNKKLREMIRENEEAHGMDYVSKVDATKIKRLYHKLAKKLHPDINPKTDEIEALQKLWRMIVSAYNANDLEGLEEAEILVNKLMEDLGMDVMEIEISDIADRIAKLKEEIYRIKTTNPYQYKYLLEDPDAVKEKKEALEKELSEYEDYEKGLEQLMEQLLSRGVSITWEMN